MALKSMRAQFILFALVICVVLLGYCLRVSPWCRPATETVRKSLVGRLESVDLDHLRQAFDEKREMAFASDKEKVETLKDLARLNIERAKEFRGSYRDRVEYGRHYHEFTMRPHPSHEIEIVLEALKEATGKAPWDMEKIEDACDQVGYGVYDVRVLGKLKEIMANLNAKYCKPELDEAVGQVSQEKNSALGTVEHVLRAIGHIGLPESAEYLLTLIPEARAEIDTRWERTAVWGALYGFGNLPPHLGIPSLEAVYYRWFPNVSPGTFVLKDSEAQGTFERVLRFIDEAYRKAHNDPPIVPPWHMPGNPLDPDWPPPTYFYGPGGIKLPYPAVADH